MTADLPPSYWLEQCRAELASAKARLCAHGVKGRCGECAETTETTEIETEEKP